MKKKGPNRRDVLAGAAAVGVAALMPVPAARPEFLEAHAQFMEAWQAYEQAREAAFIARPRIMARVRKTDIGTFFRAPEIKLRARTRSAAQVASGRVYTQVPANDAEAALQEEVLSICEQNLRMGDDVRTRFPPTRRGTG